MDTRLLSETLARVSGPGFIIKTEVHSSSDYDASVVFNDPSKKPSWSIVESGVIDTQWAIVRGQRDSKLLSCDWTRLDDVPIDPVRKTEWETYRQELRDITDQPDPFNINWPTPPE